MDKYINTCEFFNICQTNCSGTLEDTEMCHCYELYKQLQRKEQELQEAMDNYVQLDLQRVKEYNVLVDLYNAKEQECNKLYTQLKSDKEYHKEEENTLRKIIKNKEKRNIEVYKENNKLKQTLSEIKDIAENVQSFVGRINIEDDIFEQMEQILQKINECGVEDVRL